MERTASTSTMGFPPESRLDRAQVQATAHRNAFRISTDNSCCGQWPKWQAHTNGVVLRREEPGRRHASSPCAGGPRPSPPFMQWSKCMSNFAHPQQFVCLCSPFDKHEARTTSLTGSDRSDNPPSHRALSLPLGDKTRRAD